MTKEDSGIYKCTASDLETGEGIDRDIKVEVTANKKILSYLNKMLSLYKINILIKKKLKQL